jgi:hypothetical protein
MIRNSMQLVIVENLWFNYISSSNAYEYLSETL